MKEQELKRGGKRPGVGRKPRHTCPGCGEKMSGRELLAHVMAGCPGRDPQPVAAVLDAGPDVTEMGE